MSCNSTKRKIDFRKIFAGENAGITWLQHQEKLLIAAEEQQAAVERAKIQEDFRQLQKRVSTNPQRIFLV